MALVAKLTIVYEGNPVLRKKAQPVRVVDSLVSQLMDDMLETMHASAGVGLAAPQVAIGKRIIVVDIGDDDGPIKMVNPRIVEREGSVVGLEGCLSVPFVYGEVERAERVVVKGLDERGKPLRVEAEGFLARVFQHEVDHLDGVLFTDLATNARVYTAQELEQAEASGQYEPALDKA